MYQHKIDSALLPSTPIDFPGVAIRVLHQDPRTGGMSVLTRMEPGAVIPAHFHTRADETVYVLSRDFIEDGVAHQTGTFFVGAAGTPHGPHRTTGGCLVLTTFSAPLDLQLVK